MPRLRRVLFTFFAALSLLFCVTLCGMWLRAANLTDIWYWRSVDENDSPSHASPLILKEWKLRFGGGGIQLERSRVEIVEPVEHLPLRLRRAGYEEAGPNPILSSFPGTKLIRLARNFHWHQQNFSTPAARTMSWAITLPLWLVCPVLALPPLLWEVRYRKLIQRRRRQARGLCTMCGYDLRASPGRCPECGAETAMAM